MADAVNPARGGSPLNIVPPEAFQEISPGDFFRNFPHDYDICEYIATDESITSQDKPIVSFEIGNCITIFGIHKNAYGSIVEISGYHAAMHTDSETIQENLGAYFNNREGTTDIFIIGGTSESIGLLDAIHQGLDQFFGAHRYKIIEERMDLPGNQYISASLQMSGILMFCRH